MEWRRGGKPQILTTSSRHRQLTLGPRGAVVGAVGGDGGAEQPFQLVERAGLDGVAGAKRAGAADDVGGADLLGGLQNRRPAFLADPGARGVERQEG